MTHISFLFFFFFFQTLCPPYPPPPPPAPPLPLPWPVPKGSSAHGGHVSCPPLKKHGADVRGPRTMLGSSKQTRTRMHSEWRGAAWRGTLLIRAADGTAGARARPLLSAWDEKQFASARARQASGVESRLDSTLGGGPASSLQPPILTTK